MVVGQEVELRTSFTGAWSSGFTVVDVLPDGYLVRRGSDGGLVPAVFPAEDVRVLQHGHDRVPVGGGTSRW